MNRQTGCHVVTAVCGDGFRQIGEIQRVDVVGQWRDRPAASGIDVHCAAKLDAAASRGMNFIVVERGNHLHW